MRINCHRGRRSAPARILAVAAVIGFGAGFGAGFGTGFGAAQARDAVYTVSGIEVDARADTAARAREAAIADGQTKAFQALVTRLVVREDVSRLPRLAADRVTAYMRDFSVADERSSAGRYIALFTFRFNPRSVRDLFQQHGVRFAESRGGPLVVLPLLAAGGTPLLWEEGNTWLAAWSRRSFEEGLVPFRVPIGDLSDLSLINAAQAAAADTDRLIRFGGKYGGGVLIAEARLKGDASRGNASVTVACRRFTNGRTTRTLPVTLSQQAGESLDSLLERATVAVFESEQRIWKQNNLLNFGSKQTILVRVPIARLDDWLRVRLGQVSSVLTATPVLVKRGEAKLSLTYLGDEAQLIRALSQQDLVLRRAPLGGGVSGNYNGTVGVSTQGTVPTAGASPIGQGGSAGKPLFPRQPAGGFALWELGLADGRPSSGR